MSSFEMSLRQFALSTGISLDKVVRKVCIDVTSDLVKMTPVDTGSARSNWFFGYTRDASVDLSSISKNGRPSFERCYAFAGALKAGTVFYITNNLPYIMGLEYGTSKQAPAGMARVTVARWQSIVEGAARGSQKGRLDEMRGRS